MTTVVPKTREKQMPGKPGDLSTLSGADDEFSALLILTPAQSHNFWRKVDATGLCWEWTGSRVTDGYGCFAVNRRMLGAHRVAWMISRGAIPDGMQLDHLCRNRGCVRPQHLEVVTPGENIQRGIAGPLLGRRRRAKTHCASGHAFDEANTYVSPRQRRCRTCELRWNRDYRARRKAAR